MRLLLSIPMSGYFPFGPQSLLLEYLLSAPSEFCAGVLQTSFYKEEQLLSKELVRKRPFLNAKRAFSAENIQTSWVLSFDKAARFLERSGCNLDALF